MIPKRFLQRFLLILVLLSGLVASSHSVPVAFSKNSFSLDFRFGAGISMTQTDFAKNNATVMAGLGFKKPFLHWLSVYFGAYYSPLSLHYYSDTGSEYGLLNEFFSHTISLPVTVRFNLTWGSVRPYIGIGNLFRLNTSSFAREVDEFEQIIDLDDEQKIFNVGPYAELGFEFATKIGTFTVNAAYFHNFLTTLRTFPISQEQIKVSQILVTIGYFWDFMFDPKPLREVKIEEKTPKVYPDPILRINSQTYEINNKHNTPFIITLDSIDTQNVEAIHITIFDAEGNPVKEYTSQRRTAYKWFGKDEQGIFLDIEEATPFTVSASVQYLESEEIKETESLTFDLVPRTSVEDVSLEEIGIDLIPEPDDSLPDYPYPELPQMEITGESFTPNNDNENDILLLEFDNLLTQHVERIQLDFHYHGETIGSIQQTGASNVLMWETFGKKPSETVLSFDTFEISGEIKYQKYDEIQQLPVQRSQFGPVTYPFEDGGQVGYKVYMALPSSLDGSSQAQLEANIQKLISQMSVYRFTDIRFTMYPQAGSAPSTSELQRFLDDQFSEFKQRNIRFTFLEENIRTLHSFFNPAYLEQTILEVDFYDRLPFFVPQTPVFTPDGDGENDVFVCRLENFAPEFYELQKLEIRDQFGTLIQAQYEWDPSTYTLEWDGRCNGGMLTESFAAYNIRGSFKDLSSQEIREIEPVVFRTGFLPQSLSEETIEGFYVKTRFDTGDFASRLTPHESDVLEQVFGKMRSRYSEHVRIVVYYSDPSQIQMVDAKAEQIIGFFTDQRVPGRNIEKAFIKDESDLGLDAGATLVTIKIGKPIVIPVDEPEESDPATEDATAPTASATE